MRLEFAQLLEGAVRTFLGAQQLVDLGTGHAVGHQRKFQVVAGTLAHATLAREFLGVPEIGPVGRARLELVAVVGHHGGPDEGADTAFGDGCRLEVGLVADLGPVHLLEQAFVAAARHVRAFHFHHVPGHLVGFDHGLDLGLFAVVFHHHDLDAVGLFKRLDIGLLLRRAVGTTKIHQCDFALGQRRQAQRGQQGQGQYFQFQDSLQWLRKTGVRGRSAGIPLRRKEKRCHPWRAIRCPPAAA